jgi:hypothetical protein
MTLYIAQVAPTSFASQDFNTARPAIEAANSTHFAAEKVVVLPIGRCFIHAATARLDFE